MNRDLVRRGTFWLVALLVLALLPAFGCGRSDEEAAGGSEPAKVEPLEGSDLQLVTLTAAAVKRLDLQTTVVRTEGGAARTIVPYSAIVYETDGTAWVYTNPEGLSFVRDQVVVREIVGDRAVLSEGPPAGTKVVTVGVAELFGAEYGIGADDGH